MIVLKKLWEKENKLNNVIQIDEIRWTCIKIVKITKNKKGEEKFNKRKYILSNCKLII